MLPCMWGSATLAIVVSTPCIKVASMIDAVIQPRFAIPGAGVSDLTAPPLGSFRFRLANPANYRPGRATVGEIWYRPLRWR